MLSESKETPIQNNIQVAPVLPVGRKFLEFITHTTCKQRGSSLLLVNAHPDDEYTASGLISKLIKEGKMIPKIFLGSDGEGGEDHRTSRVLPKAYMGKMRIEEEFKAVVEFLQASDIIYAHLPDGGIKFHLDTVFTLAGAIRLWKPSVLITTSNDPREHIDHINTFWITKAALQLASMPVKTTQLGEPFTVAFPLSTQMMHLSPKFNLLVDISSEKQFRELHRNLYLSQLTSKRYEIFFDNKVLFDAKRLGVNVQEAEAYKIINGDHIFNDNDIEVLEKYPLRSHPVSMDYLKVPKKFASQFLADAA